MNSINFLFCGPRIPLLIQGDPWGVVFFQTTLAVYCSFLGRTPFPAMQFLSGLFFYLLNFFRH